jgi:RNA polymerase sigma-70 factor (ECF subfamily)
MNFDGLNTGESEAVPPGDIDKKMTFEVVTPEEIRSRVGDLKDPIHGKIKGALSKFCGNKYANEVEDLYQVVLIKILNGANGFKAGSSLSSWAYKIAKNAFLDFLRTKRGQQVLSTISIDDPANVSAVSQLESKLSPSEGKILDNIRMSYVREKLNSEELGLLHLKGEGFSENEMAAKLQIPRTTVATRFSRVISKIQKFLAE